MAAEPITDIDTSAAETLDQLLDDLALEATQLAFAELKGPVKDRLRGYGLYDRLGDDRFFATLGTAVDGYLAASGIDWVDWSDRESDPRQDVPGMIHQDRRHDVGDRQRCWPSPIIPAGSSSSLGPDQPDLSPIT